jgi:hypothetical protein
VRDVEFNIEVRRNLRREETSGRGARGAHPNNTPTVVLSHTHVHIPGTPIGGTYLVIAQQH